MADLGRRVEGFWYDIDRALNAAFGGLDSETISGTLGRGLRPWSEPPKWWAPFLVAWLNWMVVHIGGGRTFHCQRAAAEEMARRPKP